MTDGFSDSEINQIARELEEAKAAAAARRASKVVYLPGRRKQFRGVLDLTELVNLINLLRGQRPIYRSSHSNNSTHHNCLLKPSPGLIGQGGLGIKRKPKAVREIMSSADC
jgi:hypothetical protein